MSVDMHIPKIPNTVHAFILLSLPPLCSWLLNAAQFSPSIHCCAFALLSFSPLFMPFFRFIATHFATSPPDSFSTTLAPIPHPSFHCFSLSQAGSDSQNQSIRPLELLLILHMGPGHPYIQIGTETSGKILLWNHQSMLINHSSV